MKKYLSMLLAAVLLLSLIACASNPNNETSNTDPPENTDNDITTSLSTTTKPTVNPDTTPSITPINGGVTSTNQKYTVKQGKVVALEVDLSLPVADISGNAEVEEKLTLHLESIKKDITDYIGNMEEYYKTTIALGGSHLFVPRISVSFELNHFTEKAMSISFNITEVNGYGVTTQTSRHYNYEFDFASNVTFTAFFTNTDAVTSAICQKLSDRKDIYANTEEIIPVLVKDCWYFSDDKIVFVFNPYDIAPASSGYITVTFGTSELSDYMSDYGKDLLGIG